MRGAAEDCATNVSGPRMELEQVGRPETECRLAKRLDTLEYVGRPWLATAIILTSLRIEYSMRGVLFAISDERSQAEMSKTLPCTSYSHSPPPHNDIQARTHHQCVSIG
jgi:hypothetical protein